jgi:hypothetical protein
MVYKVHGIGYPFSLSYECVALQDAGCVVQWFYVLYTGRSGYFQTFVCRLLFGLASLVHLPLLRAWCWKCPMLPHMLAGPPARALHNTKRVKG